MAQHSIGLDAPTHRTWDAGIEPAVRIASGDVVHFATRDFSGGQIRRDSTSADVPGLDFTTIYPLAGPVFVEGAEPGDALAVEVVELRPADWGYAFIAPGLGLLPQDEFPEPYLKVFDLTAGPGGTTELTDGVEIPIEPFLGTMGVCPAGASAQPVMPPGRFGGNMDTRQLTAGSTLYLPVHEPLALFSCGDAHAAQGDGEVCVTGIECGLETATLRFTLQKGRRIAAPQFAAPGPLTPRVDGGGWYGTTGIGPDLYRGAQEAVRAMIDRLSGEHGLTREDAYVLASLVVDLRISEIVDAGEYVVSALLPLAVFAR
jgi:acetamidase/formamidase